MTVEISAPKPKNIESHKMRKEAIAEKVVRLEIEQLYIQAENKRLREELEKRESKIEQLSSRLEIIEMKPQKNILDDEIRLKEEMSSLFLEETYSDGDTIENACSVISQLVASAESALTSPVSLEFLENVDDIEEISLDMSNHSRDSTSSIYVQNTTQGHSRHWSFPTTSPLSRSSLSVTKRRPMSSIPIRTASLRVPSRQVSSHSFIPVAKYYLH